MGSKRMWQVALIAGGVVGVGLLVYHNWPRISATFMPSTTGS